MDQSPQLSQLSMDAQSLRTWASSTFRPMRFTPIVGSNRIPFGASYEDVVTRTIQIERFVIVFRFPNGDRVALDVSDDRGAVYYFGDTQEHHGTPKLLAVKAFSSVKQLVDASFNDDEIFPESYAAAQSLLR